jgi:hypothetical protein
MTESSIGRVVEIAEPGRHLYIGRQKDVGQPQGVSRSSSVADGELRASRNRGGGRLSHASSVADRELRASRNDVVEALEADL